MRAKDNKEMKTVAEKMECFPFKTHLSFLPLLRHWEELAQEGSAEEKAYAQAILSQVEKVPAIRKPIKDHNAFVEKHRELVDKLLSAVFPKALKYNEIKAVTPPFSFDHIKTSPRFQKIMDDNGGELGLPYNLDAAMINYAKFIYACRTLLVKYYQKAISLETPFIFRMKDPATGLDMFYKMTINADYADVHVKGKLKPLSEQDLDKMIADIHNVDLWKQHLPPENFEINGIIICTLVNVTLDELLSQLKNNLLESDALLSEIQFEKIRHKVRSLLKIPDLKVGLGIFDENEGIANFGHWSWRDVICKGQIKDIGNEFQGSVYQQVFESGEAIVIEDFDHVDMPTAIEKAIHDTCIKSLIIAPLKYNQKTVGYLELGSCGAQTLNALNMGRVYEIAPLFSVAVQRSMEERGNRIDAVIMEKCTAIHSSVQWRFKEAAERYLRAKDKGGHEVEMEPIVFENVHPLYGMADIRDSSEHRNKAIQADLLTQLEQVQQIIRQIQKYKEYPILQEIDFRTQKLIKSIGKQLRSQDESRVYQLLSREIEPFFEYVVTEFPELAQDVNRYQESIDPKLGLVYDRRNLYEQSVNRINSALSEFLDEKEKEAQNMYPHYFEKYKTDGIDYNIYVGKSLSRSGIYNEVLLGNIRLWQLIMMIELTQLADQLEPELPIPLRTAQLILVHDEPLSIRFRADEKKFDVDGAYNMRYEIIKKRIDKALIKGSGERATQPGAITVVYTNNEVSKEYLKYCDYLHHRDLIEKDVEQLVLEDTQGVTGLKALRIRVKSDSQANVQTQEIEEILSSLNQ